MAAWGPPHFARALPPVPGGQIRSAQAVVDHGGLEWRTSGVFQKGETHQGLRQHQHRIRGRAAPALVLHLQHGRFRIGRIVLMEGDEWRQWRRPDGVLQHPRHGGVRRIGRVRQRHWQGITAFLRTHDKPGHGRSDDLHVLFDAVPTSVGADCRQGNGVVPDVRVGVVGLEPVILPAITECPVVEHGTRGQVGPRRIVIVADHGRQGEIRLGQGADLDRVFCGANAKLASRTSTVMTCVPVAAGAGNCAESAPDKGFKTSTPDQVGKNGGRPEPYSRWN